MDLTFVRRYPGHDDRLYRAGAQSGQLWLIIPDPFSDAAVGFTKAWQTAALRATFVYPAGDPGVSTDGATGFVTAVLNRVAAAGADRGCVWLADPTAWQRGPLTADSAPLLGLTAGGSAFSTGMDASIAPGVRLAVAAGGQLTAHDDYVDIAGAHMQFTDTNAPSWTRFYKIASP